MKQQQPMVSIRFMVYNNEPFIREAIESVLMQQTDFFVEIVVGDDFSNDNTLNIIKGYKDTPNIYFNILQRELGDSYWKDRKRLGRLYNFENIIENCSGKYIALLDGDDYWTDPLKLQKQVDFLEANLDYAICFHRANLLYENGQKRIHSLPKGFEDNIFNYKDLLFYNNFITTASVVFRVPENFIIPSWFKSSPFGDLSLYALVSNGKKIKCIDRIMSVYRIHSGGIYHRQNEYSKLMQYLLFYKIILPFTKSEERIIINKKRKDLLKKVSKLRFHKNKVIKRVYKYYLDFKY